MCGRALILENVGWIAEFLGNDLLGVEIEVV